MKTECEDPETCFDPGCGCKFPSESAPVSALRRLTCCVCGSQCRGRQWHDRDTGYGICLSCAAEQVDIFGYAEARRLYGRRGVHWGAYDELRVGVEVTP